MRIRQISLRGISEAFRERLGVDFEGLGPGLIAAWAKTGPGSRRQLALSLRRCSVSCPGRSELCTISAPTRTQRST
jgi:hypothetical protein